MKSVMSLRKLIYLFLAFILILGSVVSCGGKQEKPAAPTEKEKIPKGLTSMEEKVEEIFKDIDKLDEEMKKPEKPKEPMKEKEGEEKKEDSSKEGEGGGNGQGGEEKKSGSENGSKDKEEEPKTKEEKIREMWKGIEKKIEEIHSTWNSYESKAIEDGVMNEDIEEFESSLNKLTIAAKDNDMMKSLSYLNNMTFYMATFFDMYKEHPDGEMLRLKYYSRQIYLDGLKNGWNKANEIVPSLDETFKRLNQRIEIDKDTEKLVDKLQLSLEDLKNAISEENPELLKIKVDIILKNIEALREETK